MRGLWVFPLCLLLVCRGQDVIEESSPEAAEPDAITGAPTVENPQGGAGESLPSPASEGEGEKQPFGGRPNPFPNTDGRPGRPPRPFPGGGRPPWWGPPGRPPRGPIARKPVIHLYPTETTEASVTLALPPHSRFISLVPTPQVLERDGEGDEGEEATWRVRAAPDGLMTLQSLPREEAESPPVSSLFWESEMDSDGEGRGRRFVIDREGEEGKAPSVFCVAKPKLGDWLLRALHTVGLSPREYTEMATFWAGKFAQVSESESVMIRFLNSEEIETQVGALRIDPSPDVLLRVYALFTSAPACGESTVLSEGGSSLSASEREALMRVRAGILGETETERARAGGKEREGRFFAVEWGGSDLPLQDFPFANNSKVEVKEAERLERSTEI